MFRFVIYIYILEYLIVTLIRFVLLVLLFNFVMHCIISTVVVAFEINYLIFILSYLPSLLYIALPIIFTFRMSKLSQSTLLNH